MLKESKLFKIKLKPKLKKILKIVFLLLLILIFMLAFTNVYAETEDLDLVEIDESGKDVGTVLVNGLMRLLSGILGFFLYMPMLIGAAIVITIYLVASVFFLIIGNKAFFVSPADIFFNKLPLLSIDFFDFSSGVGSEVMQLRLAVARWFVSLSILAGILLLAVLIYIAIRAVIASTGESKAKYHKMFVNWLISVGMLGLLFVIIVSAIMLNNTFVRIIEKATMGVLTNNDFTTVITRVMVSTIKPFDFFAQIIALLILAIITLQIFKYLFVYVRRMLKIAFLIIIAPLVTITYSIDKIADNKSQALNAWMHMFLYNVFIQTFHALIFGAFFTISMNIFLGTEGSFLKLLDSGFGLFGSINLPGAILLIMSVKFIGEAEKIIKQIFNIKDTESIQEGGTIAKLAFATTLMSKTESMLNKKGDKDNKFERSMGEAESSGSKSIPVKDGGDSIPLIEGSKDKAVETQTGQTSTRLDEAAEAATPAAIDTQTAKASLDKEIAGHIDPVAEKRKVKRKSKGIASNDFMERLKDTARKTNFDNQFRKAATIVGGVFAVAKGDLSSGVGLFFSARNLGKLADKQMKQREKFKENREGRSKREQYVHNTKEAAREAVDTYSFAREVNGLDPNIDTSAKIEEMQSWFRMIEDKASSDELLNQYHDSRKKLIRKLEAERGVTRGRATAIVYKLEDELKSGIIPDEDTDTGVAFDFKEGRDFASVALERKQFNDMGSYEDLDSQIATAKYDYKNVKEILENQEYIDELVTKERKISKTKKGRKTRTEKRAEAAKKETGDVTAKGVSTAIPDSVEPEVKIPRPESKENKKISEEDKEKTTEKTQTKTKKDERTKKNKGPKDSNKKAKKDEKSKAEPEIDDKTIDEPIKEKVDSKEPKEPIEPTEPIEPK